MINKLKEYFYSLIHYSLILCGYMPSNRLRKWLYKYIYRMKIGKNSVVCYGAEIRAPWKIEIGENTIIGNHATLDGRGELLIGNNVNISSEVSIWTVQHKVNCPDFSSEKGKVIVNDYVWLSTRCIILPGAEIGRGGIVAAGAVVTKNIPPNVIVGGVPANKIGKRVIKPNYILKSRRHFY